jgi:hypothetical protein
MNKEWSDCNNFMLHFDANMRIYWWNNWYYWNRMRKYTIKNLFLPTECTNMFHMSLRRNNDYLRNSANYLVFVIKIQCTFCEMRAEFLSFRCIQWLKVLYISLTLTLTELNASWKATNCAATQELPSILRNPKVYYRVFGKIQVRNIIP